MKVRKTQSGRQNAKQKKSFDSFHLIFGIIVVSLILAFFFWHQRNFDELSTDADVQNGNPEEISIPEKTITSPVTDFIKKTAGVKKSVPPAKETNISTNPQIQSVEGNPQPQPDTAPAKSNDSIIDVTDSVSAQDSAKQSQSPVDVYDSIEDFDKNVCNQSSAVITQFYNHLDSQEYMQGFRIDINSENHFTKLIQNLLDNPPIVSGETNDLFTILQNTAHFFRIIGRNNITTIKGILDREKNQFEDVLSHFYTLLHTEQCPQSSFGLQVPENTLYEYAGFFLNTMGGRLYLFRRDSMSRMVVSYYSILLVDRANEEQRNIHGIQIQPAIDQLINELETTTNPLKLKNKYIDELYDLKEKYQ